MSWQNPTAFAWLGLLLPLVALYLFRPQPRPRSVTTVFLWRQTEPSSRGGRWARRLPLHPLLLLQMAVLTVLVTVLAGPSWRSRAEAPTGERVVVVLDRSASMAAGGAFETALARIHSGLDDLFEGGTQKEAMLIAVDREPEVLVPFTSSRRELELALAEVTVLEVEDRLETLRPYLSALARDHQADVWLLSDRLPEELRLPGLIADPLREPPSNNVGFSSFAVYPPEFGSQRQRPLAQMVVENYSDSAQRRRLLLERWPEEPGLGGGGAQIVWEQPLNLALGQRQVIERQIPAALLEVDRATLFRARLEPLSSDPDDDPLPSDNLAYAALTPPRPTRLAVRLEGSSSAPFLIRALEANAALQLQTAPFPESATPDLLLRYGEDDRRRPPARAAIELPSPADGQAPQSPLRAVPGAPLVSALPGSFWSDQRAQLTRSVDPQGGQVLLETVEGRPALVLQLRDGIPTLLFAFPIERSTLPLNASLPVLLGEFLERYQLHPDSERVLTLTAGDSFDRPSGPGWTGPLIWRGLLGGSPATAERTIADGAERFERLSRSGLYRLESSSGESLIVVVNSFSNSESQLATNIEPFRGRPLAASDGSSNIEVAEDRAQDSPGQGRATVRIVRWPFLLLALTLLYFEAGLLLWRRRP